MSKVIWRPEFAGARLAVNKRDRVLRHPRVSALRPANAGPCWRSGIGAGSSDDALRLNPGREEASHSNAGAFSLAPWSPYRIKTGPAAGCPSLQPGVAADLHCSFVLGARKKNWPVM